jgi:hypothetical protein
MLEQQKPPKSELLDTFCQMFRAATRPVVTVIFAAVIAQVVIEGIDPPQWFLALAIGCITWWFGDRTVQHIKEASAISGQSTVDKIVAAVMTALEQKKEQS